MKNITSSADETLIEAARQRAAIERTTLNEQFRRWLADYVARRQQAEAAAATIQELRQQLSTGGRRFTAAVGASQAIATAAQIHRTAIPHLPEGAGWR